MHWFYGILLMVIIFYIILKKLPEPPKADEKSKREVSNTSKSKKKKNKKSKAKAQQAQVQAKLNQKIQKKNTPPKAKSNELDENEWPSLEKINEDKKTAAKAATEKKKEKKRNNNNNNKDFNITHYKEQNSEDSNLDNNEEEEEEEYVRKSSDKPVIIQNVSLPITNRKYKKHIVQENQKYISSDDEEISDREVKVVRVVEKHDDIESIELPPEVDGWKNVVPKKANVLVIKSSSNPTPVVMKSYNRKPKEEPLTKKQKENKKKAEKKKLEKQRERELQEERLRRHRLEQQRLNIGYKYVPPPKPHNTVKTSSKTPAPAPVIFSSSSISSNTTKTPNNNNNSNNNKNSKNNKKENEWVSTTIPANGITSLWGN